MYRAGQGHWLPIIISQEVWSEYRCHRQRFGHNSSAIAFGGQLAAALLVLWPSLLFGRALQWAARLLPSIGRRIFDFLTKSPTGIKISPRAVQMWPAGRCCVHQRKSTSCGSSGSSLLRLCTSWRAVPQRFETDILRFSFRGSGAKCLQAGVQLQADAGRTSVVAT
jgi:hypothetical protein